MTTVQSFFDGTLTQDEIQYYAARAKGVGAVITGSANVQDNGKGWQGELSIAHDDKLPELKQLASVIHNGGAQAIVQLFHGGRMSEPEALLGKQALSASAVPAHHRDPKVLSLTPRAMTVEEIHETVSAFGDATRRAIQAGFDGVELHGANTYLLQQFFSPHSNRRTDAYGGSQEKRYVFIKEVLDSVFQAIDTYADKPFIVGYRFSPEEFTTPGLSFENTLYLVNQLVQTRLDYLHVSLNDYRRITVSDQYQEKSILQYIHETIAGKKPLIGVGGIRTRQDITNVLNHAELAAVGQQLLIDPNWVQKLITQHDADFVTGNFADAINYTQLSRPLYDFLVARYHSTPNI